ncbi:hypothetical protein C8A01DRAFT_34930 [Parachaetomium inaequale]|uniref:Methyltransferase type 11 domain-containing protein n=1 Tax=Parachaetomium inaequale TaxID=2588326 RepID=A0AAN6PJG1_9PEZI|nr:hypothetical protein C8A01DRAFT_34930 [Parachaetomium inaequale]
MATEETQPKTAVGHFDRAAENYEKDTGGCTRELARSLLDLPQQSTSSTPHLTCHVLPGEHLAAFADDTFTHRITNLGIHFYADSLAGAREIHRTLRGPGGVAVVTSWTDLGYLEPVVKAAQLVVRRDERPYQLPLSPG